jgi:hypothetical protein
MKLARLSRSLLTTRLGIQSKSLECNILESGQKLLFINLLFTNQIKQPMNYLKPRWSVWALRATNRYLNPLLSSFLRVMTQDSQQFFWWVNWAILLTSEKRYALVVDHSIAWLLFTLRTNQEDVGYACRCQGLVSLFLHSFLHFHSFRIRQIVCQFFALIADFAVFWFLSSKPFQRNFSILWFWLRPNST